MTIIYQYTFICIPEYYTILAKESLYWPALSFKTVSTKVDMQCTEQQLANFLLPGRPHLTTKLQIWDAVFSSPTHKCEKLKHELNECLNHATFQALRKLFLHYVFHSSLRQYCGEDVAGSTNFREGYHCSTQPTQYYWCTDWRLKDK